MSIINWAYVESIVLARDRAEERLASVRAMIDQAAAREEVHIPVRWVREAVDHDGHIGVVVRSTFLVESQKVDFDGETYWSAVDSLQYAEVGRAKESARQWAAIVGPAIRVIERRDVVR